MRPSANRFARFDARRLRLVVASAAVLLAAHAAYRRLRVLEARVRILEIMDGPDDPYRRARLEEWTT